MNLVLNRIVLPLATIIVVIFSACGQNPPRKVIGSITEKVSGHSSFVGEILQFRFDEAGAFEGDCVKKPDIPLESESGLSRKRGMLPTAEYNELVRLARLVAELPDNVYRLDKPSSDANSVTTVDVTNEFGEIRQIKLLGWASEFKTRDPKRPENLANFILFVFEIKKRLCSEFKSAS